MVLNTEVKKLIFFFKWPMAVALRLAVSVLNVKVLNPKLVGRGGNLCYNELSEWFWCTSKFENYWLKLGSLKMNCKSFSFCAI